MLADHPTSIRPLPATDRLPDTNVLGRRFLAALLDFICLSSLGWIVNSTFGVTRVTGGMLPQPGQSGWLSYSTTTTVDLWWLILLAFGYFFVQEALFSTTIGKAMLHLRVISSSNNQGRITLPQALIRNFLRPLEVTQIPYSFGVGFIAIICIAVTKKRQRLGDLLAGTIVVDSKTVSYPVYRRPQRYLYPAAILAFLICAIAYCSVFYYYDRPPLVIQGLQNTHQLLDGTIQSYTLGNPSWGTKQAGIDNTATITYPVHFTSIDKGKMHTCDGHITLRWSGFLIGWELNGADSRCTP